MQLSWMMMAIKLMNGRPMLTSAQAGRQSDMAIGQNRAGIILKEPELFGAAPPVANKNIEASWASDLSGRNILEGVTRHFASGSRVWRQTPVVDADWCYEICLNAAPGGRRLTNLVWRPGDPLGPFRSRNPEIQSWTRSDTEGPCFIDLLVWVVISYPRMVSRCHLFSYRIFPRREGKHIHLAIRSIAQRTRRT